MPTKPRVYFGKLPSDTATHDIRELIDGCGPIRDLAAHGTYAFVEFESMSDAEYAVTRLNGVHFNGRKIIVEFARNGTRTRSPFRRRSPSPSYYSRRRSRSRSPRFRSRYRRRSPSRSRSPIPRRYRPARSPSPPPPPRISTVRERKVSLGSLEDGEIRSSVSSTASEIAANVRNLEKRSKSSDASRSARSRASGGRPLPSAVNKDRQQKDELLSVPSATSLVSPKHTSPSDNGDRTPPASVKASPHESASSGSEDKIEAPRHARNESVCSNYGSDNTAIELLHEYPIGEMPGSCCKTASPFPQVKHENNGTATNGPLAAVPSDVISSKLPTSNENSASKHSAKPAYSLIQDLELSDSDSDADASDKPTTSTAADQMKPPLVAASNPEHVVNVDKSDKPISDGSESDSSSSTSSSSSSSSSSSETHDSDFD